MYRTLLVEHIPFQIQRGYLCGASGVICKSNCKQFRILVSNLAVLQVERSGQGGSEVKEGWPLRVDLFEHLLVVVTIAGPIAVSVVQVVQIAIELALELLELHGIGGFGVAVPEFVHLIGHLHTVVERSMLCSTLEPLNHGNSLKSPVVFGVHANCLT